MKDDEAATELKIKKTFFLNFSKKGKLGKELKALKKEDKAVTKEAEKEAKVVEKDQKAFDKQAEAAAKQKVHAALIENFAFSKKVFANF